jgi:hypothetical protein
VNKSKDLSRRGCLVGAGMLGAGALLAKLGDFVSTAEAKGGASEKWHYEKLDMERVGETAYHAWFEVFCSQGVATGIFEQLREKAGEPRGHLSP